ncbi:hydroxypyruvate isomerase family protein [Humisphaera borealis]|uniref:TIM barrel protein n=1 Tax=Humisphaera borealis TaxID=2807512 RepID=A0A7M2X2L2_9BACT|nr:TIM barrel protein [Humisphaera borealis]QOV91849.1 TIM barrel protein [Humisphaera borealis]
MTRQPHDPISRRQLLTAAAAIAVAAPAATAFAEADAPALKGNIRQSVCHWCYGKLSLEDMCIGAVKAGCKGIDLVKPSDWPTLKKYNLVGTMTPSHSIEKGLNRKENWESCLGSIRDGIEKSAEAGYPNVICFSGNRGGMDDEEGIRNCAEALKQVVGLAEQKKVTICMELLNSKVNHKDYMCDHTEWGVKLAKAVGSDRFKLLYDIYHMQIMEGDVIATLTKHKDYIGHYHTAGVPGRHELDDTQELNYPPIIRAILATGYQGWLGQEFIPRSKEPLASLAAAVKLCDV